MAQDPPYEIPSAASGDHGLEGFSVEAGGARAGRVAAVNAGGVLIVDTGDAYRALRLETIARIETVGRTIRLTADGEAALEAASPVEPLVQRADTPRLVRHIPRELDSLVVAGEPVANRRSLLWYVGGPLLLVGAVGLFVAPVLAIETDASRAILLVSIAAPAVVLLAGMVALWIAMTRDSPRELSSRDKLADALSASLGISPRTRRRG